jgi:hypothetical protein
MPSISGVSLLGSWDETLSNTFLRGGGQSDAAYGVNILLLKYVL